MLKTLVGIAAAVGSLAANADPEQVIDGLRGKGSLSPDFASPTIPYSRGTYVGETIGAHVLFQPAGVTEAMVIAGLAGRGDLVPGSDVSPIRVAIKAAD